MIKGEKEKGIIEETKVETLPSELPTRTFIKLSLFNLSRIAFARGSEGESPRRTRGGKSDDINLPAPPQKNPTIHFHPPRPEKILHAAEPFIIGIPVTCGSRPHHLIPTDKNSPRIYSFNGLGQAFITALKCRFYTHQNEVFFR